MPPSNILLHSASQQFQRNIDPGPMNKEGVHFSLYFNLVWLIDLFIF